MHALALAALTATNLIGRHGPVSSAGVTFAERLTDGVASRAGDPWTSPLTAVFHSTSAFAVWDLGEPRPIAAVWLQGDHNDSYEVSTSPDGDTWTPLWTAQPVSAGGMRARWASGLSQTARFVRVRPVAGDGSYSLSELQIFSETPTPFPPDVPERRGAPIEEWLHSGLL